MTPAQRTPKGSPPIGEALKGINEGIEQNCTAHRISSLQAHPGHARRPLNPLAGLSEIKRTRLATERIRSHLLVNDLEEKQQVQTLTLGNMTAKLPRCELYHNIIPIRGTKVRDSFELSVKIEIKWPHHAKLPFGIA
ncbi:MAG: hypothetical protein M3434_10940, partial [Gemmatimonadota bacterium]|nr:hypothetical protein [Gemmatimonadota bacterium]